MLLVRVVGGRDAPRVDFPRHVYGAALRHANVGPERHRLLLCSTNAVRLTHFWIVLSPKCIRCVITAIFCARGSSLPAAAPACVSLAPIPQALGSGGLMWFTLTTREQNGVGQLYVEIAQVAGDMAGEPEAGAMKLLTGLKAIDIAYFGSLGPQEPPTWHDQWDHMVFLPQLVRIHAEFAGRIRRAWPKIVVQPRSRMTAVARTILCPETAADDNFQRK